MGMNALTTLRSQVLTARQPFVPLILGFQLPSRTIPEAMASAASVAATGFQDFANIRALANVMNISLEDARVLFESLSLNEVIYNFADRSRAIKIEVSKAPVPDFCDETKRREAAAGFFASCHIDPGLPWDQLHEEIRRQEQAKTPALSALDIRVLREACRTYRNPVCLKDLAANIGASVSEVSKSARTLEKHGYSSALTSGRPTRWSL